MRMTYKPRVLVYGKRCMYCGSTKHTVSESYKSSCVMKITRQWVYCKGRALVADLDRANDMLILAIEYLVVNNIVTKDEQLHKLRAKYLASRDTFHPDRLKATRNICLSIIVIGRIIEENLPLLTKDLRIFAYVREAAFAICFGRAARNMYEKVHTTIRMIDGCPKYRISGTGNPSKIGTIKKKIKILEDRGWFTEMRANPEEKTGSAPIRDMPLRPMAKY